MGVMRTTGIRRGYGTTVSQRAEQQRHFLGAERKPMEGSFFRRPGQSKAGDQRLLAGVRVPGTGIPGTVGAQ